MVNTSFSLDNKVAIVTGGSKGIGRAIALALADSGANVVVAARGVDELNATCEEIKVHGCQALAVPTDVASAAGRFCNATTMIVDGGELTMSVLGIPGST